MCRQKRKRWCDFMKKGNLSLEAHSIDKNTELLIDPGNVFWALLAKEESGKRARAMALALYRRRKNKLDRSMRNFRFKTYLNSVYINPTDLCNADCSYCYVPATKRKKGREMTEAELLYVLGKIRKFFASRKRPNTKPMIIYHASEPLLMKDIIFSSIDRFKKDFHFGIQTNAILLKKADVDFLKSNKVSVGISLDSPDPKRNNLTRKSSGGGNYAEAKRAIEWFDGYEGLSVIATVTRHNVRGLPGLVRFLHSRKVPCVLLNPVRATRKAIVKLRAPEKTLTKYFLEAVREAMRLSAKSGRRIIIANFSNIVLGIVAPQARRLMCDISPCGGGRFFFAITAAGDMIPCGEFVGTKEFSGGNIFNSAIRKAVYSAPFKKIRSRIVENIPECGVCAFRNICGAPCPAEVYALSKNINKISPYCQFYKDIINFAFRLIAMDKTKYLFRKEAFRDIKFEYNLNR